MSHSDMRIAISAACCSVEQHDFSFADLVSKSGFDLPMVKASVSSLAAHGVISVSLNESLNVELSWRQKEAPGLFPEIAPSCENERAAAVQSTISDVFTHWASVMGKPRSRLDAKRARLIKARLSSGYTKEDLLLAIDGCKNSPFHMGENSNGTKYDGIELILRDAGHVESFMAKGQRPGSLNNLSASGSKTAQSAMNAMERMGLGGAPQAHMRASYSRSTGGACEHG